MKEIEWGGIGRQEATGNRVQGDPTILVVEMIERANYPIHRTSNTDKIKISTAKLKNDSLVEDGPILGK